MVKPRSDGRKREQQYGWRRIHPPGIVAHRTGIWMYKGATVLHVQQNVVSRRQETGVGGLPGRDLTTSKGACQCSIRRNSSRTLRFAQERPVGPGPRASSPLTALRTFSSTATARCYVLFVLPRRFDAGLYGSTTHVAGWKMVVEMSGVEDNETLTLADTIFEAPWRRGKDRLTCNEGVTGSSPVEGSSPLRRRSAQ
jgi:hypothetical protein